MKQQDLERIAALIDGRLADAERDALLAEMGQDEAMYEVFTEAARLRAAEAGDVDLPDADDRPDRSDNVVQGPFGRYRMVISVLAAAAVLVISVGLALRTGGGMTPLDAALSAGANGVLPDDYTVRGWPVTRGETSVTETDRVSFRIGVHSAGLMAALGAGNQDKAIEELSAIRARLEQLDLSQPAILEADALLQSVSSGDLSPGPVREFLSQTLTAYADPEFLELGTWVESNRVQLLAGSPLAATSPLRIPATLSAGLTADLGRLKSDLDDGVGRPLDPETLILRLESVLARY